MKIGKLDPRNLFDKGQEKEANLAQEKEMYNNIVIGKLNTKNIFEGEQEHQTLERQTVQVGKLKTKVNTFLLILRICWFSFTGGFSPGW